MTNAAAGERDLLDFENRESLGVSLACIKYKRVTVKQALTE